MSSEKLKQFAQKILDLGGIKIGGDKPWDLIVHIERFYGRVMSEGLLGLGESYMDGWWDVSRLDMFFSRLLDADAESHIKNGRNTKLWILGQVLFNRQKKDKAFTIGERHYDLGNDIFETMLDRRLTYTCGYWQHANNLDEAQEAKLDLICRKIDLRPGQRVLDIGCGWGSFAKYAAEKYQAEVVGVTVSKEQAELGRKLCAGLPVELLLQDYREVKGMFDHIVSLGMFEHVGYKNYRTYMEVVRDHLKDGGLFLLHTIGSNETVYRTDPWIGKYIFPNSMIPSIKQIGEAIEKIFIMEDWHNFGMDYDRTLMAWMENFQNGWSTLREKYGDRFYRMWAYYLNMSAAGFRSRYMQLWQIVLSKKGVAGGYASIR